MRAGRLEKTKSYLLAPSLSSGDDSLGLCKVVQARRTFIDVDFAADASQIFCSGGWRFAQERHRIL